MAIRYPKAVHDFIRENYKGKSVRELAVVTSDKFGIDFTYEKMRAYLKNHSYRTGAPKGSPPGFSPKYPQGMDEFVRRIAQGRSTQEITDLVNAEFGEGTITVSCMKAYKKNHGINSGLTGRFEPGSTPKNKGKTWDEYMPPDSQKKCLQTAFRKGNVPHNAGVPVGAIRIRHNSEKRGGKSYIWQKTAEPNVWRMKNIIEWEEHNGPVPDGHMVTFADGDTLNWHIGNLILVTRAQNAVKNRFGIRGYNQESAKVANAIADVKIAASRAQKRR